MAEVQTVNNFIRDLLGLTVVVDDSQLPHQLLAQFL